MFTAPESTGYDKLTKTGATIDEGEGLGKHFHRIRPTSIREAAIFIGDVNSTRPGNKYLINYIRNAAAGRYMPTGSVPDPAWGRANAFIRQMKQLRFPPPPPPNPCFRLKTGLCDMGVYVGARVQKRLHRVGDRCSKAAHSNLVIHWAMIHNYYCSFFAYVQVELRTFVALCGSGPLHES